MIFLYRFLFTCFCYSSFSPFLFAQNENIDSLWTLRIKENVIKTYYQSIKENAPFFNGAEYTGHGQNVVGHPFFGSGNANSGFLEYDGVLYTNVSMKYDIVDDAIIVIDFTNNFNIKLNTRKIGTFSLGNNVFVQPAFYQLNENIPGEGFYQQLYNGFTTVLVKQRKQVIYKATDEGTIARFVPYNLYFIKKEADYLPITRKKDVLEIYRDRKGEIGKFIEENKLNFRKDPGTMLEKIAAYYDQIKS